MQPIRLTFTLDLTESELLRRQAERDLRRPREQARFMLRQALLAKEGKPPAETNTAS